MNAAMSVCDSEQERARDLPLHLGGLGELDTTNTEQITAVSCDLLAMLK